MNHQYILYLNVLSFFSCTKTGYSDGEALVEVKAGSKLIKSWTLKGKLPGKATVQLPFSSELDVKDFYIVTDSKQVFVVEDWSILKTSILEIIDN